MERQDAAPPKKTFSPQALFSRERAFREALLKFPVPANLRSRATSKNNSRDSFNSVIKSKAFPRERVLLCRGNGFFKFDNTKRRLIVLLNLPK